MFLQIHEDEAIEHLLNPLNIPADLLETTQNNSGVYYTYNLSDNEVAEI